VEEAVSELEATLLPELTRFGELLAKEVPGIASEAFSHRHAPVVHNLGLSCLPAGSNALDHQCVALIVTLSEITGLALKGYVAWQAPSNYQEAETPIYRNASAERLGVFCRHVRELMPRLRPALLRGGPPG
jgi:hypothetical protein